MLYYMMYGQTPFQKITNLQLKLQAITDGNHSINFGDYPNEFLRINVRRCLNRDPHIRPSIEELLKYYPWWGILPKMKFFCDNFLNWLLRSYDCCLELINNFSFSEMLLSKWLKDNSFIYVFHQKYWSLDCTLQYLISFCFD